MGCLAPHPPAHNTSALGRALCRSPSPIASLSRRCNVGQQTGPSPLLPAPSHECAPAARRPWSGDNVHMSAVLVSELGLNPTETRFLQQQIAASQQGSTSSQQASHASSQGRILLDPTSLQALGAHFDRLMYSIQQRWQYLTQQTTIATQVQYDRAGNAMEMADAEIARFRAILREIDELQVEFDKVQRIGEIVKGFKSRVTHLERRL